MATLYVRDVPDDLYEQLKSLAEADGRSISAEAVVLLRRAVATDPQASRAALDAILALPPFQPKPGMPSSTELLREDRDR